VNLVERFPSFRSVESAGSENDEILAWVEGKVEERTDVEVEGDGFGGFGVDGRWRWCWVG